MASLDKQILEKKKSYDHAKKIVADENNPLRQHYINDLDNYQSEIKDLKKNHKLAKAEYDKLKTAIPNYEKYLELFENVADLLRSTSSLVLMDRILRKFFSNITLQGEFYGPKMVNTRWKVTSSKLKEPYAGFLKSNDFERGRRTDTSIEPALVTLYDLLICYKPLQKRFDTMQTLMRDLIKPERAREMQFLL